MADGLINLTIDGAQVSVPPGTLVIEAAKQAGVLVPHYCYHPGLPVAGVCRMCLVEIEKAPKLQIACATTVTEGMVVKTQTAPAKDARQSVLEFLLINHPLDCPICDQAGECELQDFVFQEGQARTRYAEFAKRFNPVEDFGPDVLYVPNRCILCTRCVRFMEDVAKEPVLNVSERGDRAFIGIHPEARLDHPWAGNVVDLCPVGSLLSKDFLHKARAWELDKTASICTGCSQGCNITLDTRDEVVVRVRPRPNLDVNRYFICDHGRMHYKWMRRSIASWESCAVLQEKRWRSCRPGRRPRRWRPPSVSCPAGASPGPARSRWSWVRRRRFPGCRISPCAPSAPPMRRAPSSSATRATTRRPLRPRKRRPWCWCSTIPIARSRPTAR